jgi:hypothetical protein
MEPHIKNNAEVEHGIIIKNQGCSFYCVHNKRSFLKRDNILVDRRFV